MYPSNVNSQEPLARDLAMKAAARERRRSGFGGGISETVQPAMDSLSAQALMDDMQSAPSPRRPPSPIRLASTRDASEGGSPSPIMTAQYRRSGSAPAAAPQGQCRPGMQCYRGGPSGPVLSNKYNLGPGETLLAVDGVPVNAAAPSVPAPPPMPPQVTPGSFAETATAASETPMAAMTPDTLLEMANQYSDRARASFGEVAGAANDTFGYRAALQSALDAMNRGPELDLANRQVSEDERNGHIERLTQLSNLQMARENSIEGNAEAIDHMLAGMGAYANMSAAARQEALLSVLSTSRSRAGAPMSSTELDAKKDWVNAQIAANDIGRLIAQQGVVKDGAWGYGPGNLDTMDEIYIGRYLGRTDDKKNLLVGKPLEMVMLKDLQMPMARHIEQSILQFSPKMDRREAARLSLDEAEKSIRQMAAVTSFHQANLGRGEYGTWEAMKYLDDSIERSMSRPAAPPAMGGGLEPARAWGAAPPQGFMEQE